MNLTRRILLALLATIGLCVFLCVCWWLGGCKFQGGQSQYMLGVCCGLFGPFAFCAVLIFSGINKGAQHD